jgi:predicted RNase H-like HicB family nuclease
MKEIVFDVNQEADGGYVACWDDPRGGGITTQGDSLAELQDMVTDAVGGYFEPGEAPGCVRLHFTHDPIVSVA